MAVYSSAVWEQGNSGGSYLGGPRRIVWHTTEVLTAAGAIALFRAHNSWSHFTVDETTVYQHVDTSVAARALENRPGGVQTNHWHAVQIELVARVARWIEETHDIPRSWPAEWPAYNPGLCLMRED